jgi:toxin ParE1/3/4
VKIVWSPLALDRLSEITEQIALDRPAAAERLISELFAAVARLGRFPASGRMVPELRRSDLREIVKAGYRIIYRVESDRIAVLTVRHVRQATDQSSL